MAKKHGNPLVGGDKKTRDKVNRNNPRGTKRGGKRTLHRRNTKGAVKFNSAPKFKGRQRFNANARPNR